MMRVAIAGTGGLAYLIAHFLREETGHPFIFLSRSPKPQLTQRGFQVVVVNFEDPQSLQYALTGVSVIISTIPNTVQIKLIDAAISAGVRRFAPAEFEGRPSLRPLDALDRGKTPVLAHLQNNRQRIESTIFVCGVLYERFAPYGLYGSDMGKESGIAGEGDYLLNLRQMTAQVPLYNSSSQHVAICMTAAQDVARFVVRALELRKWPPELTMCGERMTTQQLVTLAGSVRGRHFHNVLWHDPTTLRQELLSAQTIRDGPRTMRALQLIATEEGRYDFVQPNLNAAFPSLRPMRFQDWLTQRWSGH